MVMVKKVSTINIDENILKLAKKEIPNLSSFVENCLKIYLGLDTNINTIQNELNTIKQCQLNIHILTQLDYENVELQNQNKDKINKEWLKIWGLYRNTETIIDSDIMTASVIIGKSYTFLTNMMEILIAYIPKNELSFCDDFDYSLNRYNEIVGDMNE